MAEVATAPEQEKRGPGRPPKKADVGEAEALHTQVNHLEGCPAAKDGWVEDGNGTRSYRVERYPAWPGGGKPPVTVIRCRQCGAELVAETKQED